MGKRAELLDVLASRIQCLGVLVEKTGHTKLAGALESELEACKAHLASLFESGVAPLSAAVAACRTHATNEAIEFDKDYAGPMESSAIMTKVGL